MAYRSTKVGILNLNTNIKVFSTLKFLNLFAYLCVLLIGG
jgi:hypothetical protein